MAIDPKSELMGALSTISEVIGVLAQGLPTERLASLSAKLDDIAKGSDATAFDQGRAGAAKSILKNIK